MKLSDLVTAVGDENVLIQNLINDAHTIDKTRHGTKITFYTDALQAEELLGGGQSKNVGFVVWMPRHLVDSAVAAYREVTCLQTDKPPSD